MHPFYIKTEARIICLLGTYSLMIFCFVTFPQTTDKEFDTSLFKLITGSSMWAFLSHPLWQNLIVSIVYKWELSMWPLFFLVNIFTVVLTIVSYGPMKSSGLI